MIYITQLIFVKAGKEAMFHEFEDHAIPLMAEYNGKISYRLRPDESAFISGDTEKPYEVHIITFDTEKDLEMFMKDDRRLTHIHLKNESVTSILMFKGQKI